MIYNFLVKGGQYHRIIHYNSNNAKAYINWILLDERFNYVSSNSGFEQVGSGSTYTTHTRTDMPVSKNGYLFVLVSNASPSLEVFFDNLQVTHIRRGSTK